MKRWAFITVFLYLVILVLLTMPVLILSGLEWRHYDFSEIKAGITPENALRAYKEWGYWIGLAVIGVAQAALLLVPLRMAETRLKPRRHILVPAITTGFLAGNLFAAGFFAVACAFWGDDALEAVGTFVKSSKEFFDNAPVLREGLETINQTFGDSFFEATCSVGSIVGICWLVWALLFFIFARADDPASITKRAVSWLLRGSILELLVAVPSHVVIRGRTDCCAPGASIWGITTGLSVMLLAFGPGVFFLFAERVRRLRPPPKDAPSGGDQI